MEDEAKGGGGSGESVLEGSTRDKNDKKKTFPRKRKKGHTLRVEYEYSYLVKKLVVNYYFCCFLAWVVYFILFFFLLLFAWTVCAREGIRKSVKDDAHLEAPS